MAFDAEKHGKSAAARRSAAGNPPRKRGGLLFGGGFALGVATTALGFFLLQPELTAPAAEEASEAELDGQGALAAAPPSAAGQAEQVGQVGQVGQAQPTAALQPTAAAGDHLQPTAAPAEAVAASPEGTETTPSAATAAPGEFTRPQVPPDSPAALPTHTAPKLAVPALSVPATAAPAPVLHAAAAPVRVAPQPAAPAAKPEPVAAAPAKPEPPVDPNSQDAKLAAAARVRLNAGTPIDSMLDQAFSPTASKADKADKPAAPSAVPPAPTRDDVIKSMSVLVPAIRGCAQGQSGMAPVSIVVHSDGRVESAALSSGPFQGTASGRCMEGVVRRARFPRFSQPSFRVQFPFAIQ